MLVLFDVSRSNYERPQLARIATDASGDAKVLKERMDDSIYVGNGFLYQLEPTRFKPVPSQLVRRCGKAPLTMLEGGGELVLECMNFAVNVVTMAGTVTAVLVALYLYWAAQRPDVIATCRTTGTTDVSSSSWRTSAKASLETFQLLLFDFEFVQKKYRLNSHSKCNVFE